MFLKTQWAEIAQLGIVHNLTCLFTYLTILRNLDSRWYHVSVLYVWCSSQVQERQKTHHSWLFCPLITLCHYCNLAFFPGNYWSISLFPFHIVHIARHYVISDSLTFICISLLKCWYTNHCITFDVKMKYRLLVLPYFSSPRVGVCRVVPRGIYYFDLV